jgi:hypothetical protein
MQCLRASRRIIQEGVSEGSSRLWAVRPQWLRTCIEIEYEQELQRRTGNILMIRVEAILISILFGIAEIGNRHSQHSK